MNSNLFDPFRKVNLQEELGGIYVHKLPPHTVILIRTVNSEYVMEILEDKLVTIVGGKKIKEPTVLYFNGSTWGGSMLKMDWIGFGMHMEFAIKGGVFTTTPVQDAKIFTEKVSYELGWSAW